MFPLSMKGEIMRVKVGRLNSLFEMGWGLGLNITVGTTLSKLETENYLSFHVQT